MYVVSGCGSPAGVAGRGARGSGALRGATAQCSAPPWRQPLPRVQIIILLFSVMPFHYYSDYDINKLLFRSEF